MSKRTNNEIVRRGEVALGELDLSVTTKAGYAEVEVIEDLRDMVKRWDKEAKARKAKA